jgi:simple sugar transport system ATP-binding protein
MHQEARRALDGIGISLDEHLIVGGLPIGHMQFIEIAREVDKENAQLLVFDEPTAVLTEGEAGELLGAMKTLAGRGIALLFITHRLEEVMEVADRITVLRDGEVVESLARAHASVERLAELMIGRSIPERDRAPRKAKVGDRVLLRIEDLHVEMPGEEVHGVDLEVREGEILGLAGLAGQGKIGIANGVMGLHPARGRIEFRGEPLPLGHPLEALRRRIGFVSEDRRQVGLLLDEPIDFNIAATAVQVQRRFLRGPKRFGWYDRSAARAHAATQIEQLDIRCRGPEQPVRRLSG